MLGISTLTLNGLGALLHARELAQQNVPGFDFTRVDRMLNRFRFVMALATDTSVGPICTDAIVDLRAGEYQDMADVAFHAKLYTLNFADFDFNTFARQLNQLAAAAGVAKTFHIPWVP